jgi:hypothetical protein
MPVERREWVTRVVANRVNRKGGTHGLRRKAAAFSEWHEPDKSRGLRPVL